MKIRVGSRPSRLAITQVEEVMDHLPGVDYEIIAMETEGDRDKVTPLTDGVAANFFTYDVEKSLLDERVDVAIHSAKDLEEVLPNGLVIAAMTRSISPFECLVSRSNLKMEELPAGAVVGTSSLKRRLAVERFRGDLIVKDIRGNIDERISQLDQGIFDAIIVARAALIRLKLEARIAEIIPPHIIKPHPLQGRLAVQVKEDRVYLINIFRRVNDE